MSFLSRATIYCITRYQKNGGGANLSVECNFVPSCSEYFKQAVRRFGFFKGVALGVSRIRRCNKRDIVGKIYDPLP